jgi:hypothetical protein
MLVAKQRELPPDEELSNVLHLFADNASANAHNRRQLNKLTSPLQLKSRAYTAAVQWTNGPGRSLGNYKVDRSVHESDNKKAVGGLPVEYELELRIGTRVMLKKNHLVEGCGNGHCASVIGFSETDLPVVVFDHARKIFLFRSK